MGALWGAVVLTLASGSAALAADTLNATGEASLARELNGRVPGQPVSCIDSRTVVDTWVVERTAILYRMRDGTVYVNRPSQGAEALARDAVKGVAGYQTLCERFGVGMFSAGGKGVRGSTAVRLGAFTPYTQP